MDTYDRLARHGYHRWWTPPLTILAVLFATAAGWLVVYLGVFLATLLAGRPADQDLEQWWGPFGDTVMILALLALEVPLVLAAVRLLQRRPAGTVHSVAGRVRWRWLGLCGAVAVPCSIVLLIAVTVVDAGSTQDSGEFIGWGRLAAVAGALLLLVPLQAAGEEYAFRGFLLQTLGGYGRVVSIALSAVAFSLAHGFSGWPGFAALVVSGITWAVLTIVTGGLEAAVAAHAATNLLVFVAAAPYGGLDVPMEGSAADASLPVSLLLVGADLVYAALVVAVLILLRRYAPQWAPQVRRPAPPPRVRPSPVPFGPLAPLPGQVGPLAPLPGQVGPAPAPGTWGPAPAPGTWGPPPAPGTWGPAPAPGTWGPPPAPGTWGPPPAPGTWGAAPAPGTLGPAPAPGTWGAAPAPGTWGPPPAPSAAAADHARAGHPPVAPPTGSGTTPV